MVQQNLHRLGFRRVLRFEVLGLGLGVWGLGFGVWGLGFGVWGLGLRIRHKLRVKGSRAPARVHGCEFRGYKQVFWFSKFQVSGFGGLWVFRFAGFRV